MSLLSNAIIVATGCHMNQLDKHGAPYILHSLRVMLAQDNDEARIVAVLHDVPEHFPGIDFASLGLAFSDRVPRFVTLAAADRYMALREAGFGHKDALLRSGEV